MTTPKKTAKTSGNEARELADLSEDIGIRFKYPNSERVYLQGSRDDIRVPLREIRQDDTYTAQGAEANPPIPVYDTSGVYGDPAAHIDLKQGLPHIRTAWLNERGDTEILPKLSSEYGIERAHDPKTAHLRFNQITRPRRAKRRQRYPASLRAPRHHHARNGVCRHTRTFKIRRIVPKIGIRQTLETARRAKFRREYPDPSRPNHA